jgi:hypothetical protein
MKMAHVFLAGLGSILLFVSQDSFAARMTVYNEIGNTAEVTAFYSKSSSKATIAPGGKHTFNSGVHAFNRISWNVIDNNGNKIMEAHLPIGSSRTMLTGKITLRPNRSVEINFDEGGASSKKLRAVKGDAAWQEEPISRSYSSEGLVPGGVGLGAAMTSGLFRR